MADGRVHAMRKLIGSGIWELFIPGIGENAHYKSEIRTGSGAIVSETRSVLPFLASTARRPPRWSTT